MNDFLLLNLFIEMSNKCGAKNLTRLGNKCLRLKINFQKCQIETNPLRNICKIEDGNNLLNLEDDLIISISCFSNSS